MMNKTAYATEILNAMQVVKIVGKLTEKINDETAISVSSGRYLEVTLTMRWLKAFNSGSNQLTRIGIRITKVEKRKEFEVNGIGQRQEDEHQGKDLENVNLGSYGLQQDHQGPELVAYTFFFFLCLLPNYK